MDINRIKSMSLETLPGDNIDITLVLNDPEQNIIKITGTCKRNSKIQGDYYYDSETCKTNIININTLNLKQIQINQTYIDMNDTNNIHKDNYWRNTIINAIKHIFIYKRRHITLQNFTNVFYNDYCLNEIKPDNGWQHIFSNEGYATVVTVTNLKPTQVPREPTQYEEYARTTKDPISEETYNDLGGSRRRNKTRNKRRKNRRRTRNRKSRNNRK